MSRFMRELFCVLTSFGLNCLFQKYVILFLFCLFFFTFPLESWLRTFVKLLTRHSLTHNSLGTLGFTHGSGVESIPDMVSRTNLILAPRNRVPYVGRALGDCRLVVLLPTSQASFFWLVVCLPNCVQKQFCLHCCLCPLK